jgi:cell division septum initiation protein DivIVA
MKFVGTGAVLSEGPRSELGVSLHEALKAAQDEIERLDALHANTEKECAGMLASARAEAANIVAAAQRKADEIKDRVRKFEEAVGPIAKQIADN